VLRQGLRAALVVLVAAPAARAADPSSGPWRKELDRILDRPAFAHAYWAAEVRSLASGRVLYARNAERNLHPASSLKLVTTAAALDVFGPAEKLRTTLETAGRLDSLGRILGDVYLVGRGDPSLSSRFTGGRANSPLEALAGSLAAAGVRRIEGRLVGHEGHFPGDRRGERWTWDDLVWCYGAEVSALAFNDNCATLTVAAGERAGDPLVVDRDPASRHYQVVSTAVTSPAGTAPGLVLQRDPGSNQIRLSGTYPIGQPRWEERVAIVDPARYAATVLAEVLEARGITVAGGIATSSDALPANRRVLVARESPPMAELLRQVNKPSQNLYSEMLLRALGAKARGAGTPEAGHEVIDDFLRRIRVPFEHWELQDGSGLSRGDLVSPHGLVGLLAAMDRHPHAQVFRDSLPVAGVDGTLAERLKGAPTEGRVQAKTGTLAHTNALAGYVSTRRGEKLAFAFIVNHHTGASSGTAAIDDAVRALAGK
jgi:D-alanyl-D-alanine carboxypeptidase/D-alanyl-D-alanine-endopeptidase (penicillin-binding protein 4)